MSDNLQMKELANSSKLPKEEQQPTVSIEKNSKARKKISTQDNLGKTQTAKLKKPNLKNNIESAFNSLLNDYFAKDDLVTEKILDLKNFPAETLETAQEIFEILRNSEYEISTKFNISLISEENLVELLIKTGNYSLALQSFTFQRSPKISKAVWVKSLVSIGEFDKFSKLMNKSHLLPRLYLPIFADELTSSAAFKKSKIEVQVKVIAFLASNQISPIKMVSNLENVTEIFNSRDDSYQNNVVKGLRKWNINAVYQFLTHIDSDRIRISLCNQLIEDLTVDEIASFFTWHNPDPKFSKIGIFKRIINPAVNNFLKWNHNLDQLLILWPHLVSPEYGFKLSELKVKFKFLIGKTGYLPESLRDDSVPILQDTIQSLKDSLKFKTEEVLSLKNELGVAKESLENLNAELSDLRESRQHSSRKNLEAQEAIERQLKIDSLRELIPAFDIALQSDRQEVFRKKIEEINIEIVGLVGQKVRWNPQICESLTGEDLEEGIVAKSGIIWFSGRDVVPLRRMLIKPE